MISIVSTVFNKSKNEIISCLKALYNQTLSKDLFEIILIDDFSDNNSIEVAKKYIKILPLRIYKTDRNIGQCGARNLGIEKSIGDIVLIKDMDVIPNKYFLEEHLKSHEKNDIVIGPCHLKTRNNFIISQDGSKVYNGIIEDENVFRLINYYEKNKEEILKDSREQDNYNLNSYLNCITRNFSIKRNLIKDPFFNENFSYKNSLGTGFGWEDLEMGYRMFLNNYKIHYNLFAFVVHISHDPILNEVYKPGASMKNFYKLIIKHPGIINDFREWFINTYNAIYNWFIDTVKYCYIYPYVNYDNISIDLLCDKVFIKNDKMFPILLEKNNKSQVIITDKNSDIVTYYQNYYKDKVFIVNFELFYENYKEYEDDLLEELRKFLCAE